MFEGDTEMLEPRIHTGPGSADTLQQAIKTNPLQEKLATEGFAVLRDVLTSEQVADLRRVVKQALKSGGSYKYGGKFQLYAMYAVEDVAKCLTSEAILDRLKEIMQPSDVVLTGECDLMINTTSSWHTDVPHYRSAIDGSIFRDETFKVYKIAFYLQDQDESSHATLKVRPRSHLKGRLQSLPEKPIGVRAGDAIIFDVRIEHAGQMPTAVDKILRRSCEWIGPRLHLDVQRAFTSARSVLRTIHGGGDRVAVFMTFGPSDAGTYSYIEEGWNRHPGDRGTFSPAVLARLAVKNVAPPFLGTSASPQ